MATFTFGLDSSAVGSMAIPYEVPDDRLPVILEALGIMFGATVTEPVKDENGHLLTDENGAPLSETRDKTPAELLRHLADSVMRQQMATIQARIEDAEVSKAAEKARANMTRVEFTPGEPQVIAPTGSARVSPTTAKRAAAKPRATRRSAK